MPATSHLEKAQRYEVKTLTNLELRREQVRAVLQDEARITSNVKVAKGYLGKLEDAVTEYKQAVAALLTALEDEVDQKQVDPLLNDLHNVLNSFKAAPIPPLAAADTTSRNLAAI